MTGKEIINILRKQGWILDRVSGSHYIMIKENKRSIPVPVHGKKELPKGLVYLIFKQAGIKEK
ncbi:type II toxin-antitoxin system HicA family toxin [candidate division WOR-3 bacterium]|nr:type II toxin-antitoxin system HicA family toxin [candidate division WOR-3 bacterium]